MRQANKKKAPTAANPVGAPEGKVRRKFPAEWIPKSKPQITLYHFPTSVDSARQWHIRRSSNKHR